MIRSIRYSPKMDTVAVADQLIAENVYLTLATADEAGAPWSTPVWFAPDGRRGQSMISNALPSETRSSSR